MQVLQFPRSTLLHPPWRLALTCELGAMLRVAWRRRTTLHHPAMPPSGRMVSFRKVIRVGAYPKQERMMQRCPTVLLSHGALIASFSRFSRTPVTRGGPSTAGRCKAAAFPITPAARCMVRRGAVTDESALLRPHEACPR